MNQTERKEHTPHTPHSVTRTLLLTSSTSFVCIFFLFLEMKVLKKIAVGSVMVRSLLKDVGVLWVLGIWGRLHMLQHITAPILDVPRHV